MATTRLPCLVVAPPLSHAPPSWPDSATTMSPSLKRFLSSVITVITIITDIIWHHLTSCDNQAQVSDGPILGVRNSISLSGIFPFFSNLSLLTFPFITSTKLGCFQYPIPFLESALNLLSLGDISCSIMFSFDIDMIRNKIYFW